MPLRTAFKAARRRSSASRLIPPRKAAATNPASANPASFISAISPDCAERRPKLKAPGFATTSRNPLVDDDSAKMLVDVMPSPNLRHEDRYDFLIYCHDWCFDDWLWRRQVGPTLINGHRPLRRSTISLSTLASPTVRSGIPGSDLSKQQPHGHCPAHSRRQR
jgi:hypothetical protein